MSIEKLEELSRNTQIVAYCVYICQLMSAGEYSEQSASGAKA